MSFVPIMLSMPGDESPALADFQAENTLLANRGIDLLNFYQSINSEPLWYGAYATWSAELEAPMFISWALGSGTLGAATSGTYDSDITAAASQLNGYSGTVYIRLCFEMNGTWNSYGNTHESAASFISGWQYVISKLRTEGVTNAKYIWSPNIWGGIEVAVDPVTTYACYPGDSYVDYVAVDGYEMLGDTVARTPSTIFLSNYQELSALTSKPFGFGEIGCSEDPRLTSLCGGKAGWFNLLFEMIATEMPNCAFMDYYNRYTSPDDFTINSSTSGPNPAALAAFQAGVTSWPFKAPGSFPQLMLPRMATA